MTTPLQDHVIDLPLTRDWLSLVADPERTHRCMATYLPDLGGRSRAIRADTGTQYRLDLPQDPLGSPRLIRLRLRSDVLLPGIGTPHEVPPLVDGTRVVAVLAAEYRTTKPDGTMRVRAVPDAEASAWATDLLARHGLAAHDVALSPQRSYGNGRDVVHFTVRDLAATVTLTDPDLAARALALGVGHGRAYGLGMLVPTTR
ncbi:CRISPR associated protein [Austwickia chelonae]|uniref:CRISPR-associated protein n=1 Tax=Austwickia chelonae NBRC 105200 TaxID=1184607 RepID=K6UNE3_9MICO|nr:type I-E CRISPR-associated protein Cas6/Cse3/CasE [Austwickia chelonae]GAB78906.1 hypothetical protein AUCHE_17_01180 [Austwickia chelonae NBRC 105200]SEV86267.1 CRISPR associated protein [Austwickia chelonae]